MSGKLTLISSATASGSASLSFTSGIDSTYDEYQFWFVDIHPATDAAEFSFQVDSSSGSSFNKTMTTSYYRAYHFESDGAAVLGYDTASDQANGTGYQTLALDVDNDADSCVAGKLCLYRPSSTSLVKHFMSETQYSYDGGASFNAFAAGYINEPTTAISKVSFKFSSGNIDAGQIHMFGVS